MVAVLTADGSVAVQRYRPLAVLTAASCDDLYDVAVEAVSTASGSDR